MHPDLRETTSDDMSALEALYRSAFPQENLIPLVRRLLDNMGNVLCLAAIRDGHIFGHIAFTNCEIPPSGDGIALLGPLAVAPVRRTRESADVLRTAGLNDLHRWDAGRFRSWAIRTITAASVLSRMITSPRPMTCPRHGTRHGSQSF